MKSVQYLFILLFTSFSMAAFSQVPLLNSYPSAKATVYIDFDGQYVSGTFWNWSGDIAAQPALLSTANITEIFNRVSEDYRPFDLNITTDSTVYWNAPIDQRIRIIVTATSSWYGAAGGVAYVGSFTWGDNTPGWVFSSLLFNNPKNVAEAISHETGHTLGLQHQSVWNASCVKTAEYSTGQGSGEIGWAPIMGAGYYQNVTTWQLGPNTISCNNIQNDFDIIRTYNGFGLRPDDHGDDITTATDVPVLGGFFNVNGIINTATDLDAFRIQLTETSGFTLTAVPHNVGSNDAGANIDIKVYLMNGTDTINAYNPSTLLNAGIDTNLNAGTYYLVVDGVGNVYHNDYGSLGNYSLVGSVATLLPVKNFHLQGMAVNDQHQFTWNYQTNETITEFYLESSTDGKQFNTLQKINAGANVFAYTPPNTIANIYYRLRIVTASSPEGYYSNTIVLKNSSANAQVQVTGNSNPAEITLNSNGNYNYQLYTGNGQLLVHGLLKQGANTIGLPPVKGLLVLHYNDAQERYTQKIIKQ